MNILGINAYHGDSSACLVIDGKLVAAAEEERFRRIKHWAGFPSESIRYCLKEANLSIQNIDHVAVNSNPKANLGKKLIYVLKKAPQLTYIFDRVRHASKRYAIQQDFEKEFSVVLSQEKIHRVEHHLCHMSSCYSVSPFKQAVVVSVDGFGDFASAAWGVGHGRQIQIDQKVYFPHSLGLFYQALTQYLGFPNYGDEYKLMGLTAYGEPKYLPQMKEIVHVYPDGKFALNIKYFLHDHRKFTFQWEKGSPVVGQIFSDKLETLLGQPPRKAEEPVSQWHKDVAASVQAMYETAFFNILNKAYEKYNISDLALAGGCAMNSLANGRIYKNTSYKRVYIQSAAGDAGGAIGAAFAIWNELSTNHESFFMNHAYWGPHYDSKQIKEVLNEQEDKLQEQGIHLEYIESEDELCKKTAQVVSQGNVIGWFQGRMEWGPRALGNRSIVCDPRRADMKDILNLKIKRRESFRPFAPSVLREETSEWFEYDDDVPFMMKVFPIRKEKQSQIPAVTHVDGTGRLQTVSMTTNPRYYKLIQAFKEITGVPMVLNTSFNENEPIVLNPQQALDCFLRTKMDVLVLGNYFLRRTK